MRTVIGIDVGGSTTKIVGFPDERMTSPLFVKANDPLASVYGALGKFVAENGVALSEIEKILVTGVGQAFLTAPLYAVPTAKVNEFTAIGLGGLYLTGLSEAIIVSMGTGTAFVDADADGARHLGGTGNDLRGQRSLPGPPGLGLCASRPQAGAQPPPAGAGLLTAPGCEPYL